MSPVRVLPCGPAALLLEVDDGVTVAALHHWLQMQRLPELRALVPAARTVLVEGTPATVAALRTALTTPPTPARSGSPGASPVNLDPAVVGPPGASPANLDLGAVGGSSSRGFRLDADRNAVAAGGSAVMVEIPVVYDGEDLPAVADACEMSVEEVVRRHSAATYTAAFCGFAPGFAYLVGGEPALRVPRRADPRPRVPAGSLAVAGEYTAVYPSSSPGGWHLLGRALVDVWAIDRDPPALISPGTIVRFVP